MTNNFVIHKANTRGMGDFGWLKANYSFSFANYHNPERVHFGVLRVLNDDTVAAGMGFGTHPHENMEIITIPLEGAVEHKDSMGNSGVIQSGDIQMMSAGTGIYHSEFNHHKDKELKLLQIWIFPNKTNVAPRYDQIKLPPFTPNNFQQIVSPFPTDDGAWIHQNAWFHLGELNTGGNFDYTLKDPSQNGVYIFVIEGQITIDEVVLDRRDALGIWSVNSLKIQSTMNSRVLIMEVPMDLS